MIVTDTTIINKATPLYPDIMVENAEEVLREKYKELTSLRDKLSSSRTELMELEKLLSSREVEYRNLASMFTIEYGTKEIQEIKNPTFMEVINREDARNW